MLGLDKKCIKKLDALDGRQGLSDAHVGLVASLCEWYRSDGTHFFTSAQRNLIDKIYDLYVTPLTHKELIQLEFLKSIGENELASDWERQFASSMLAQHGDNPRAWAPQQAKKVKDIIQRLAERKRQKAICVKLDIAIQEGTIPAGAERFCRDVVRYFEVNGEWTVIQKEHVEKILNGNLDPEDDEDVLAEIIKKL